jgi:epidermal growth factor receptor kinase substrate 8
LEHLATFTVSPENDMLYPADGMRRLLAMEKTNGIWTQKMLMRLDRGLVNIMDHENKEVVERFPIHLVREPTAFTSNDPKEIYNNILIYIVGTRPEESPTPAEMHIFQCVNVRSRDVVEDLKHYMSGNKRNHNGGGGGGRGRHSPDFPEIKVGDLSPYEGSLEGRGEPRLQAHRDQATGDETSSTSSDKYEKDVTFLNRCFDDIEKFIARLQHSAAAFRDLENRRRTRKSKKNNPGDGMLSMRAKPPPEAEFIDIFQKFKLSFNLLAKLKSHIHDPNAPELVHFLFTPLALIVDASHDSHYGPNLSSKVMSPLLTANAIDLLVNCLTSKESELWHSLGESWYIPLEDWKGFVPPFRPVFMDGYAPSVGHPEAGGSSGGKAGHIHHHDVDEVDEPEFDQPPPDMYPQERMHKINVADVDDIEDADEDEDDSSLAMAEDEQRGWLAELQRRGCRIVQVTYPRTANNEKELSVVRGEFLEVVDDTRNWWKTRNARGQLGHVPHTIVTGFGDRPSPQTQSADWVQRERRGRKGEFRYF